MTRCVEGMHPPTREILLDGGNAVRARSVILANGVSWRRVNTTGFDRLMGKGIYYGASLNEASSMHGLDVFLIGAGNSAGQAALNFASYARHVTLIVRGDSLEKGMSHYWIEQIRAKSNISSACNAKSRLRTARRIRDRSTSSISARRR